MTGGTRLAGHSAALSLAEVKAEELKMLVAFRDLCEAEGLRYSLCGGTLLGAVRHKGFIPWDDDVDVCMPRPDYERLLRMGDAVCERCGCDLAGYFGLGLGVSPFAKLLSRDVAAKAAAEAEGSMLWVDVLPVDALPDDDAENGRLYARVRRIRDLLRMQHVSPGSGSTAPRRAAKALAGPLLRVVRADERCARRMAAMAAERPWGSTAHVGVLTWGMYGPGERMPLAGFEQRAEVEFEGGRFSAMSCWHEYLTGIYGDYMTPPPEGERAGHGIEAWRAGSEEEVCR